VAEKATGICALASDGKKHKLEPSWSVRDVLEKV